MKPYLPIAAIAILALAFSGLAYAGDVAGTWSKTTHPDPNNIIIIYSESAVVKAAGFEHVAGQPAYWCGEGILKNGHLTLHYHYSADATPFGWEPEGTMRLTLSADGQTLSGAAMSKSGQWSDRILLQRISLVIPKRD